MTYDAMPLILSETKLSWLKPFGPRVQPRPGVALVLVGRNGATTVIRDQQTRGEAAFSTYVSQAEIDVARHDTGFSLTLKSAHEDHVFAVVVDASWRVFDPVKVLRDRPVDAADIVRRRLRATLGQIGRRFDIEQVQDFETAARAYFGAPANRALNEYLHIESINVEVSLDADGQKTLRERRDAVRKRDLITETHRTKTLAQQYEDELAARAKEQELELESRRRSYEQESKRLDEEFAARRRNDEDRRRREEEERQADLRRREEEWKAEMHRKEEEWKAGLRRQEEEQQNARELERARLFMEAMEKGDAAVLAVHLGRSPDDAKELIQRIVDNQALNDERRAKLLADMIEKDMIIGSDLEGLNQELIRTVMGISGRRNGGVFSLNATIDMTVDALSDHAAANAPSDSPTDD